jgi:AcrR family transcriptional regulator
LAERGYAGTTFPEILKRAELSNGALWRHFRTKDDLLVAAALHSEAAVGALPTPAGLERQSPARRIDAAVDYFWRHYVTAPAFQALIELLRASRSDPDLARRLAATDERSGELFFATFARLVGPDLAAHPDFRRNVRLIGLTFYGVGVTSHLRAANDAALQNEVRQMLRALFGLSA